MQFRLSQSANRPVLISLCLVLACVGMAVAFAASAQGAYYKMVACAGNNGTAPYTFQTNTTSPQNPAGIFAFYNWCGGQGGDPPGEAAFMRIEENQPVGNAGVGAYGNFYFDTPAYVHYKAAGGYTREPLQFNAGWRARFWIASACCTQQMMVQGAGLPNSGGFWATTGSFAPHLWPVAGLWDFTRFVFELQCVRPAGCDRAGSNVADLNGMVFILSDDSNSQVAFTDTGSPLMQDNWVRGGQTVHFQSSDLGSGIRRERMRIDGAQVWLYEHIADCAISASQVNGEWARTHSPCPTGGPWDRSVALDTATLADGGHTVQACTQDYAQFQGLYGTGGETCAPRTIHTDNTAPGAPSGLQVTSANPERYLDRFGARFVLPPDQGSPITKVHYEVRNAAGDVVKPKRTLSATNPTALSAIEGPATPGAYTLRVWLEDQVGHVGAPASAPVPHDTTPPAAPQALQVAAPDSPRSAEGFDLRWRNIVDAGSPIEAAHYRIEAGGGVVVPAKTVGGHNPEAVQSIEAPNARGSFAVRLWLSDAEGNVGAPTTAPLSYECVRSSVGGGRQLTASLAGEAQRQVAQGQGVVLTGELRGEGGDIAGAPLCIFEQVSGEAARGFLGIAITGSRGDYRFAIAAGPNRTLRALYRPGQRRLAAEARLRTQVKPTLGARKQVIRTGEAAHLYGSIPGPRNDDVVIVLQVRQGKGWLAFRRYRTRGGGRFEADYLFRRTTSPTTYEMRAQVRESGGYPYVEGDSEPLYLRVLPKRAAKPCPRGKRRVKARAKGKGKGRGKARCVRARLNIHKRCARARRATRRHPAAKAMRRRARRLCVRSKQVRRAKQKRGQRAGKGKAHRRARR